MLAEMIQKIRELSNDFFPDPAQVALIVRFPAVGETAWRNRLGIQLELNGLGSEEATEVHGRAEDRRLEIR